jgi:OmpR family response regulator RpaB
MLYSAQETTDLTMLRVLLIDDDEKLAPLLCEYCAMYNITIESTLLPSKGLERLHSDQFDAIILDVMLPEMDGFKVCRKIRETHNTPIIMLTARGEVTDRIVGLETGADDYLPKPFEPRELVARLNNIVKRKQTDPADNDVLRYPDLVIDQTLREVSVSDNALQLTTMEYELLVLLANSPGKNFSRDDILNHLKGTETELFSRSVDILVSRLRTKLKPLAPIKTVYGSGYTFVGKRQ